jgi:hypothetical protein
MCSEFPYTLSGSETEARHFLSSPRRRQNPPEHASKRNASPAIPSAGSRLLLLLFHLSIRKPVALLGSLL